MQPRGDDRAVSGGLAEFLLVAIALIAGIAIYAMVTPPASEPPLAMAVTSAPAGASDWTLTFSSATPGSRWEVVAPALDGEKLTYDGDLAADGTWCRLASASACVATGAFDPQGLLTAGDQLRVHHAAIAGKTFELRDEAANVILVSLTVR